jgi:hypothetical protein
VAGAIFGECCGLTLYTPLLNVKLHLITTGSIVLFFVLWYSYGRWRARNARPVIRGSGVLAEDEVHLQPQQYAQRPSTDTVTQLVCNTFCISANIASELIEWTHPQPVYSPPNDPPPNYPAPTNPGVPPTTAYAAPNYPPPDSRPT